MFLTKSMVNGSYYWRLMESFREDGKVKKRTVRSLGNTEKAYETIQEDETLSEFLPEIQQFVQMRSPLIWFGGKSRMAKSIMEYFPAHKTYVEPFGGAAHVLVQKQPSKNEVYNDLNGDVVNFFMQVRADRKKFYEAVKSLPYARALYEEWRTQPLPDDPFERAVRWFYINRSGIVGAVKGMPGGWRHGVQHATARTYQSACELIEPLAERLGKVNIESKDYSVIIEKYDHPETFFYIDPPYRGREGRYAGGFNDEDHKKLANMLSNIKGKALISYYPDPLIDELYAGWNRVEFDSVAYSKRVGAGEEKPKTTEILLMNYTV